MRLLIVRHADPEYSAPNGGTITPSGHLEAAALAARLKAGLDFSPNSDGKVYLYSSPMGRARDTARYTEEALGLVAEIEEWTRELSHWPRIGGGEGGPDQAFGGSAGAKEVAKSVGRPGEGGLALWDIPGETLREFKPDLTRTSQWEEVPDIGAAKELYQALCAESDKFIARHGYVREEGKYRVVERNRDTVVVFCHGGFGLTWLSHLLQLPLALVWSGFWLAPSSVTTVVFDERSVDFATPRVLAWGDTGHMTQAGLRVPESKYEKPNVFTDKPRPSGIKSNFF